MIVKAVGAKAFARRLEAFVAKPAEEQTLQSLLSLIHLAITALKDKSWSDAERAMLSRDGITALSALEIELMAQIDTLKAMRDRLSVDKNIYADERGRVIELLADMSGTLTVDADEFIDHVQSLMKPQGED